jgi:phosphohistidine phosphatase
MKTLYILRHGKSSWDFDGMADEERTLTDKGIERTLIIGDYLLKNHVNPDLIITSHAVRALETAKLISGKLDYNPDTLRIAEELYYHDENGIGEYITKLPDFVESVMIIGHNPAFTNLSNRFLEEKLEWLPTSGILSVTFETGKWQNIFQSERKVNFYVSPRTLKIK